MEAETRTREAGARIRKPWYRHLYAWVLAGIALGVVVGYLFPSAGTALEPVGTSFVGLIKMLIAPIVFCTVVVGIASVDSLRKVGRVGLRTLVYFELVTTVALALGIIVMNVFKPGSGVHADPTGIKVSDKVSGYIAAGKSEHWYDFIVHIIPTTVVSAFADGDVLQVLFVAVLFAIAVKGLGQLGEPITAGVDRIGQVLFRMLHLVMYAAPVGAFGAMAFTVGKYGIGTLTSLGGLVLTFYATSAFFVLVVLGAIAARSGVMGER